MGRSRRREKRSSGFAYYSCQRFSGCGAASGPRGDDKRLGAIALLGHRAPLRWPLSSPLGIGPVTNDRRKLIITFFFGTAIQQECTGECYRPSVWQGRTVSQCCPIVGARVPDPLRQPDLVSANCVGYRGLRAPVLGGDVRLRLGTSPGFGLLSLFLFLP